MADAAVGDSGTRAIRSIAEVPPLGPSADGNEVDVPLSWVFALSDPAPTGSAPYVVAGGTMPCGFEPAWTISTRVPATAGGGEVQLRMRARRRAAGAAGTTAAADGGCTTTTFGVSLVSLSILRLGEWRVVDAVPHGPADPVLVPIVQRVVPDDAALRPAAERWTRACVADAECPGGVCASVGAGRVCVPPRDPWLHNHQACPGGTRSVEVSHTAPGATARQWQACVAACGEAGRCPGALRCDPLGVCVPVHAAVSPG